MAPVRSVVPGCLSCASGSLKMSLAAPLVEDQTCRLPEASQEARWGVLLLELLPPSQQVAVTGLLCPVYCTSATRHRVRTPAATAILGE